MSEGDSHESDILFCPFCGDVDALEVQHLEGAILYPAYRVACDNCGAAFAIRSDIDEWNTRALPAVQPDAADRIEQLTAERERLALAICGGEDAPGYANAQTVETLEHVAKQNRQSHWATINSLLAEEAERDEALNQLDSARYSVEVLEKRVAEFMAERDRLREALDETAQILSQCTFETIRVHGQYIDRREAVLRAREALKGETP